MGADAARSPSFARAPIRIDEASPRDDAAAWDAFVSVSPDATLFHRSAWQRAVAKTFGYRSRSLVARRDGRVTGILPLSVVPTLPWGRALVSAPQAVYGGPAAEDAETRDALLDRARGLGESLGARYVELRNLAPLGDLPTSERYVTFRRAILPTEDENMAAIPRNQRRSIRIGLKSGLTSEVGGTELLEPFYDLYSHSVRNLGTPVFPKALFSNLMRELESEARILVIRREGRPVASVLTFFFRDEVLPYYGGARKEEFRYAVNDFMYWSLLLHGMERGCRVFDFGRSKKGSGSYDFKRHWGFEPQPLHYQYVLLRQRSVPDLSPKNPKYSLAIECWKRMPLWLSQRLGPTLVRYFP